MHDNSSISEIADKTAGQDSYDIFKILISLGKKCVVDKSENRPEMVVVYMNLQNIMSSNTNPQQCTSKNQLFYYHHIKYYLY